MKRFFVWQVCITAVFLEAFYIALKMGVSFFTASMVAVVALLCGLIATATFITIIEIMAILVAVAAASVAVAIIPATMLQTAILFSLAVGVVVLVITGIIKEPLTQKKHLYAYAIQFIVTLVPMLITILA